MANKTKNELIQEIEDLRNELNEKEAQLCEYEGLSTCSSLKVLLMNYCSECAKCIYDKDRGLHRCEVFRHEILWPDRYLACDRFKTIKNSPEEKRQ